MDLKEYQQKALSRINPIVEKSHKEENYYACMGLMEETGEIVSEIRKALYKGNYHEKQLDEEHLAEEIGDLLWYMALSCKNIGIEFSEIRKTNSIKGTERNVKILKKLAIELSARTGKVINELNLLNINETKKAMQEQYEILEELCEVINKTIEEILEQNVNKVNNRYDEKGKNKKDDEIEI